MSDRVELSVARWQQASSVACLVLFIDLNDGSWNDEQPHADDAVEAVLAVAARGSRRDLARELAPRTGHLPNLSRDATRKSPTEQLETSALTASCGRCRWPPTLCPLAASLGEVRRLRVSGPRSDRWSDLQPAFGDAFGAIAARDYGALGKGRTAAQAGAPPLGYGAGLIERSRPAPGDALNGFSVSSGNS